MAYHAKYFILAKITTPTITSFIIVQGEQSFMPQTPLEQVVPSSGFDVVSGAIFITASKVVACPGPSR